MQLFANKAGKGAGEDFTPWHPNFRNTTELPDTKTVRTRFFVNAAAVTFAVSAMLYAVYTEYLMNASGERLATLEAQIAADTKPSQDAVVLYKKFKEEEARANEFINFGTRQNLAFSDFVATVGECIPPRVMVTSVQYGRLNVTVKGFIRGTADEGSGIASSFERKLKETPEVAARFDTIALANLSREVTAGALSFEIVMTFKKKP